MKIRLSLLFSIFLITLSVTLSIGFIDASAQEDDTTPQKTQTIHSVRDIADGFDDNQIAMIISPGDTEFSGSITFEASVPVDVVVFGNKVGGTVWTADHKHFFGFNVIDSEITKGKSFFTGYGLAFIEPLNEKFDVTYTLDLDSDENQMAESEIEQSETKIIEEIPEDKTLPPLQQIKSGVNPKNIQCNDNLTLIFKSSKGSPACVSSDTALKLLNNYGWGLNVDSTETENVETEIQDIESNTQDVDE